MTDEEAERHRLRRTTRHLLQSVGAVVLFGLALVGLYFLVPRTPDPPPPVPNPTPSGSPVQPQQQTLLIQATTAAGALGSVLTGYAPAAGGSGVLLAVPADLVVAAPGVPPQPLQQTVATIDTLRSATTLAATLGVRVDATWRLDRKALAGLVDSVSGITVTVPSRVRVRDEEDEVVLVLRPGRQRLSGTDASWYAVGSVPEQTDLAATARFDEVLLRTLARLPDSDVAIRESLTALGALAPSTIATQDLATYLRDLSATIRAGALVRGAIPSTQVRLGLSRDEDGVTTQITYRWTDYREATPLIRAALPAALWQVGVQGPPRVLVLAEAEQPGWLGYADGALTGAGFVFVDGRGTRHGTGERSHVLGRGSAARAPEAAATLGIPEEQVETSKAQPVPVGRPWADVDVNLGRTWTPGGGDE